jgi:hypothetical protein
MNFDTLFPSKWMKASDLGDEPQILTIKDVDIEKMNDGETKPVVYFKGSTKGLVLNVTNGRVLADLYGSDTDDWVGKQISLVTSRTDFQGRQVDCIRLQPVKAKRAAVKPAFDDSDDDIVFAA